MEPTGSRDMNKSLQTAKIEELLEIYKIQRKSFRDLDDEILESDETKAELFWIKSIIKDLKWLLDDETY